MTQHPSMVDCWCCRSPTEYRCAGCKVVAVCPGCGTRCGPCVRVQAIQAALPMHQRLSAQVAPEPQGALVLHDPSGTEKLTVPERAVK